MKVFISEWANRYLPNEVSDRFVDADAIAEWLRASGYQTAQPVRLPDGNQCAIAQGYQVWKNGYVCRF